MGWCTTVVDKEEEKDSSLIGYETTGVLYEIGVYTKGDLKWLKSTPEWKDLRLRKLKKDAEVAQQRYEEAMKNIV